MTILFVIIALVLAIIEIVTLIKFFQMAGDMRALKQYFIDGYKLERNDVGFKRETYYKDLQETMSKEEWNKVHELPTELKSTQTHIED